MRKDRLEKLAELLINDANNAGGVKFDLRGWAGRPDTIWGIDWNWPNGTVGIPVNCGTVACALGLAAISGLFKDEGFGFKLTKIGTLVPIYAHESGYLAAKAFFEISLGDSQKLFSPDSYPDHLQAGAEAELAVANRIRMLIDNGSLGGIPLIY